MDVGEFLGSYPPFDSLSDDDLMRVASDARVEEFPAGTMILEQAGTPASSIYVVASGSVELLDPGRVIDVLGPGELFGHPSAVAGLPPALSARAREDARCYLLPAAAAPTIFAGSGGLAYLSETLRERTVRALEGSGRPMADPWRARVGPIVSRRPIVCDAARTIRDAAELMARERISSVLVADHGRLAIVTDRDLRARVVASGRSVDGPLIDVASSPVVTVAADAEIGEVLLAMLEHGVHHLPVTDAKGDVTGVVTDTDLMGLQRTLPFALKREIERAPDRRALVLAGRQLPGMVASLVDARIDPVDVGRVVGVTIDALTSRTLELEIDRLGAPPAPWAWIALGSQARHEQALSTDQDHLLAYDLAGGDPTAVEAYFAALAEAVTAGIEEAGVPRCKAGITASRPAWRASLDDWIGRFRGWMTDLGVEGSVFTAIAFDLRRVAGPLGADERLRSVAADAGDLPVFIKHLARGATATRPPTGFLHDFVVDSRGDHVGTLDVKHGGITLITSIARTHALATGSTTIGTLARLRDAATAGRIDGEDRAGLEEAFRLLWQVRLEHQSVAWRAGRSPDDHVDPQALGPITRQGLKAAFRMIAASQRAMASDFGLALR
jgi:CBS domain-containing protein